MSKFMDRAWLGDTLDRAVSTVAQAAVATITAYATGLLDLDWVQVASVAGLAGLVSVLQSVAARGGAAVDDSTTADEAYDVDEDDAFEDDDTEDDNQ